MARFRVSLVWALLIAVLSAQDKPPARHPAPPAKSSPPDPGVIADGMYRNSAFGFSYKLPFGWVDRTAEMQDGSSAASTSRVLLAIFERPPQATGDGINSAVVIAAEPLPAGMKTAAEYLESLSDLTTAKGFKAEEAQELLVGGATRLVRGDFSKPRGTLTMRQTSLVTLAKGYAISFTFIGGSEDEVSELIEKLSFAARKPR
jgi:hypothetical protein